MLKRVFTINFLDSFIFGATTVVLPLLMLDRGISIASIGVAFALAPLAKMLVRLFAAAWADKAGERLFYTLNGFGNAAQSVAYILAQSAPGFAFGKAIDGARESFIWAVARTSIMHEKKKSLHFAFADLISGRYVYFALGSIAVGFLYPIGGFGAALALCAALGLAIAALSLGVKNTHTGQNVKLSDLSFSGREKSFYDTSLCLALGGSFYLVIVYAMAPLYLRLAGFSLGEIGLLYAAYFLLFGLVMNYLSRSKVPSSRSAAIGAAVFILSLFGMGLAPVRYAPFFFVLMSVGDAHLGINWEEVIYLQAKKSRRRSIEIALIQVPSSIGAFLVSAASGFVAESYGFAPIFVLGAASLSAFAYLAVRLSQTNR